WPRRCNGLRQLDARSRTPSRRVSRPPPARISSGFASPSSSSSSPSEHEHGADQSGRESPARVETKVRGHDRLRVVRPRVAPGNGEAVRAGRPAASHERKDRGNPGLDVSWVDVAEHVRADFTKRGDVADGDGRTAGEALDERDTETLAQAREENGA